MILIWEYVLLFYVIVKQIVLLKFVSMATVFMRNVLSH